MLSGSFSKSLIPSLSLFSPKFFFQFVLKYNKKVQIILIQYPCFYSNTCLQMNYILMNFKGLTFKFQMAPHSCQVNVIKMVKERQLIKVILTRCLPSAWEPLSEFISTIIAKTILAKSSDKSH